MPSRFRWSASGAARTACRSGRLPACCPARDCVDDVEYLHKRAISGRWSKGDERTGRLILDTVRGRHMERRIPVPQKSSDIWQAWAWGDRAEIEGLLPRIAFIGKRRGAGGGEVDHWEVSPAPDMTAWTDAVCRDGRLVRPLPMNAAALLGLSVAASVSLLGWTPPYRLPSVQTAVYSVGTAAEAKKHFKETL